MSTTLERWSQDVRRYDVPHLRLRQVAALVERLSPGRMLDIGCARGQLGRLCPEVEYVGCDFVVPDETPDFEFHACDLSNEPLPAELGQLELVVCCGILEYIQNLPRFLADVRSRLLPGGHLIATYFNMNHISRIWTMLRGDSFRVHPDWRGFHSPRAVTDVMRGAGFEIVESYATDHALGAAPGVDETTLSPTRLHAFRPWSRLLGHQHIHLAKNVHD